MGCIICMGAQHSLFSNEGPRPPHPACSLTHVLTSSKHTLSPAAVRHIQDHGSSLLDAQGPLHHVQHSGPLAEYNDLLLHFGCLGVAPLAAWAPAGKGHAQGSGAALPERAIQGTTLASAGSDGGCSAAMR